MTNGKCTDPVFKILKILNTKLQYGNAIVMCRVESLILYCVRSVSGGQGTRNTELMMHGRIENCTRTARAVHFKRTAICS
jgi:hypothetical protein